MLVALQFACLDSVSKNVATAERLVMGVHKKGANIFSFSNLLGSMVFGSYLSYGSSRCNVLLYPTTIGSEPQDEGLNSCVIG